MQAAANATVASLKELGQEASVNLLQPSIDGLVEAASKAVTSAAASQAAAAEANATASVSSAISDAVAALVALGVGASPEEQLGALMGAMPALVGSIATTSRDFVGAAAAAAAAATLQAQGYGALESQLQPQITGLVDAAAAQVDAQKPPGIDVMVFDLVRTAGSLTEYVPNVPTFTWANGSAISGFYGWSESDPPRIPGAGRLRPVAVFNDAAWRAVSGEQEVLCTYVCQVPAAEPSNITFVQSEPACPRPTPTTVTSGASGGWSLVVLCGVLATWA